MIKKALILTGASALLGSVGLANAATGPTFSILLSPGASSNIKVDTNSTATVQYTVRNNLKTSRVLTMRSIPSVSQIPGVGKCNFPSLLGAGQSCQLDLLITGSQVPPAGIAGGPQVCKTIGPGNPNPSPNLCSVPDLSSTLNITPTTISRTVTQSINNANNLVLQMLYPFKPTLPPGALPWRVKPFISSIWGILANGFNIPASVNVYSSSCGNGANGNSFCIIAGNIPRTDNIQIRQPVLLQSYDGGLTWSTVSIPAFPSAQGKFSATSCGTDPNGVSTCAGIGMDTSTNVPFLVQTTDSGQTWNVINASSFTSSVTLNAVDCTVDASSSLCQATGNDGTGPVMYYSYPGSGTGSMWLSFTLAGSNISPASSTSRISCASLANSEIDCLVALNNNYANTPALVKAGLIGGANYIVTPVSNPGVEGTAISINDVGCTASPGGTAFCTAAGSMNGVPFLAQNADIASDSNWAPVSVGATPGQFSGVSCTSLNGQVFCNAAGNINPSSISKPYLVVTKNSGTAWDSPVIDKIGNGSFTSSSATVSAGGPLLMVTGIAESTVTPVIVESTSLAGDWYQSNTFASIFEIAQE